MPRLVAKLALLVAWLVVWIAVGAVVPLVLTLLSIIFGQRLRAAAAACVGGSRRAGQAIGRASDWLSGHRADDEVAADPTVIARVDSIPGRVRIVEDGDRVRVHSTPPMEHESDEEEEVPSEAAAARRSRR